MKIPNSVRIAGVEFDVVITPNLMNGATAAYGHIDYDNSTIALSDTFGTEHQKRCRILWHEILHGIQENNGMEIENEEAVIDMFAKGIYQVLQDNGARFFDIVSSDLKQVKADTLRELQDRVTTHFGTYRTTDEVPITDVFRMLSKIEKELLEGGSKR